MTRPAPAGADGTTVTPSVLLGRDLRLVLGERRLPAPAADEALVRVEWAGLCGSDLHVMRTGDWVREWPATLGHELVGRVEAAGADAGLLPGAAVVADSRFPVAGGGFEFVGEACPGGFATHCVLPASLLHPVPDGLDGATAVLAEPLAVALHALGRLAAAPERVAILGHGPIGALLHAELHRRFPAARVDVAEPASLRAALAAAFGTARVADAATDLDAGAYDVVIDCAGYPQALPDALRLVADAGEVLLLAIGHSVPDVPARTLVERGLRLTGCNAFTDELPAAVALLASDGWRFLPVVTDTVDLAEAPAAFERQLAAPEAVKLLVRP